MVSKKAVDNTKNVRGAPDYEPNTGACQSTILTFSDVSIEDEEFVLGPTTYQWKAEANAAAAGKVKVVVGTDAATSRANTVAAINANDPYFSAVAGGTGEAVIFTKTPTVSGLVGVIDLPGTVVDTNTVTIGDMVFEINSTGGFTAGRINVAVSALTKLVVAAALTAAINTYHPYVCAVNTSSTNGQVSLYARPHVNFIRGGTTTAGVTYPYAPYIYLAETLDGANGTITAKDGHFVISETATNAAFSPSTTATVGGIPAAWGKCSKITRAVTTADASTGWVYVPLGFIPSGWIVQCRASGVEVQKSSANYNQFDGAVTINADFKGLKITKGTAQAFANGDILHIIAWE
jgi:hypothetical protein